MALRGEVASRPRSAKAQPAGKPPRARSGGDVVAAAAVEGWGWLPSLAVVGAFGLLLVAVANSAARAEVVWAGPLFWAGVLALFAPPAARLVAPGLSRREGLGLIAMLGMGLYVIKVLHSPSGFTLHDELLHWRTVDDIGSSGHLFQENPLLPASPLYPGLHSVTSALVELGGLSIFDAGVVALAAARLVFVLALYLLYEQAGQSSRVAAIAALLYMANPNFAFFDAQFAYESLALPLATLTLYAAARRARAEDHASRVGLTLVVLLGLGAVVITHHLTAYVLLAFLALWTAADLIARRGRQDRPRRGRGRGRPPGTSSGARQGAQDSPRTGGIALLAVVAVLAWLVYVAGLTVGYLGANLMAAAGELLRLIAGEATGRQLFRDFTGQVAPLWEQLAGYASVVAIVAGLPFGLHQVWRHHRASPLALALAAWAVAYPASQALRVVPSGLELSGRASEFVFLGVAFVLGAGIAHGWLPLRRGWRASPAFATWAALLFVGGLIIGWPAWGRMPGPYLVAADTRSIEPQGVAAADWAHASLGPGNRVLADRTNRLLMGSYGRQRMVTGLYDSLPVWAPFFASELGPDERHVLRAGEVRYLVVDRRLASGLPPVGVYVEHGEPDTYRHTTPMDAAALAKFDRLEQASRVFDSGDITVYDVEALADGR